MGLLERRANRRTLSPSVDPAVTPNSVRVLQMLAESRRRREDPRVHRRTRTRDQTRRASRDRRLAAGVQRVFEAARAAAIIDGRSFVTPDDVKRLAQPTMAHRVVLTTEATVEGVDRTDVVRYALETVDVPAVAPDEDESDGGPESTDADEPADADESPTERQAPDGSEADQEIARTDGRSRGPSPRRVGPRSQRPPTARRRPTATTRKLEAKRDPSLGIPSPTDSLHSLPPG